MGDFANPRWLRLIAWVVVVLIVSLNIALIVLTATGAG
jgi:Mn2+/Fe2+ NRAMP family transporter